MKVLSLFDGISCGQVALDRAGIPIEAYYASEIDKYAIKITQRHYPNTIQLGDVTKIDFKQFEGKIDLLIGGSPCQDLSIAGKREGLNGSRSSLFWKYAEALNTIKPKYYLFENNYGMPKEAEEIITETLGVVPIMINSCHFSAQNRKRLYWTNINVDMNLPMPCKIIADIKEDNVDNKYYMKYPLILKENQKDTLLKQIGDIPKEDLSDNERQRRVYSINGISPSILARSDSPKILCVGNLEMKASKLKIIENAIIRKLTPLECERLQTLEDNYTECISNTQRYKCIGNGWTVDVIVHILRGLKNEQL